MQTISEALRNSPFPTGSTASSAVSEMDDVFDQRATRLAKIKDMYDRKPPWDPAKLREAGQSYRANLNTGELEAIIDNETSEATLSVYQAAPTANFKAQGVGLEYRKKLAQAYDEFLKQAESFSWFHFVDKVHFETNLYGFAAATFNDNADWRPSWRPHLELRFPEDATPDVRELDMFAVHTRVNLADLFKHLDFDPDQVSEGWVDGWNVEELRKFLVSQINGNRVNSEVHYTNLYFEAAQALRDGTGWAASTSRFQKVKLTHLYAVHPLTGKVCHYIMTDEPPFTEQDEQTLTREDENMPEPTPDAGILYYEEEEFDSMEQALWLMSYNLGPSTLASVRGLGYRAYTHTDLSNRFFSQVIDGSSFAASMLLQTAESDTQGRVPLVRLGPVTVLPSQMNPVQNSFNPNFQHLISVRDMSSNIMHNSLGTYRQRPSAYQPNQKSAREVQAEIQSESEAKQNRATYRMQMWTGLHKQVFNRLVNQSWMGGVSVEDFTQTAFDNAYDLEDTLKELDFSNLRPERKDVIRFFLTLVKYGFPLEILFEKDWRVEANRGYGAGSQQTRIAALQNLMSFGAMLPKERADELRHAYVLELTSNPDLADDMFPSDSSPMDSREFLTVVMENNDMKEGREIPVPVDVDHILHFQSHLSLFYQDLQVWQKQSDEKNTTELSALGRRMIPHIGSHLEYISRDPMTARRTEEFKKQFEQAIGVVQEIMKVAQQVVARDAEERDALAQKLTELEQKANSEAYKHQERMAKIQGELQLDQMKTESLNQSRVQKTQAQAQVKQFQTMTEENRKQQQHIMEMNRKMQTMQMELERLRIQNEQMRASTNNAES